MSHTSLIPGSTTGTAVPASYLGEIIGAANAGTGGSCYHTRTTTVATTTGVVVVSLTLNKGEYLIGFNAVQQKANNTSSDTCYGSLRIGTTAVTGPGSVLRSGDTVIANAYLMMNNTFPINITADGAVVDLFLQMAVNNAVTAANSMWAVRIA